MSRSHLDRAEQRGPSPADLQAALGLAVRAPSLHNTQPWQWLIGGESVHLHSDPTRCLPGTDSTGREMVISCGAALNHFVVALAASGWRGQARRLPAPGHPSCLAVVEFSPARTNAAHTVLAAAIPGRRTDRRRFNSWPVPSELIGELIEMANHHGARLQSITKPLLRWKLFRAILDAAEHHAADPTQVAELAAWTGRAAGSTDGVPATHTPAPQHIVGQPRMRAFVHPAQPQPPTGEEPEAAALLLLSTAGDSLLQWLCAGEIASAALLAATRDGLASSLLTEPLEVGATREYLQAQVVRDPAWTPQLLLRIGWLPPGTEELAPTPRRPLTDVVAALDTDCGLGG